VSAEPSVLQVVILQEGALVGTEVFPQGSYKIGRDASNDLVLADARVSSRHATLAFKDGRIFLRDDNSANGTFVNGQRAAQLELKALDDVHIGPFTLKFRTLGKKKGEAIPGGTVVAGGLADELQPRMTPKIQVAKPDPIAPRSTPDFSGEPTQAHASAPHGQASDDPATTPGTPSQLQARQLRVVRGGVESPPPPSPAISSPPLSATVPSARRSAAMAVPKKEITPAPEEPPPPAPPPPKPNEPYRPTPRAAYAAAPRDGAIHTAEVPVADDDARPGRDQPMLRARVLWGRSTVHVRAFEAGASVIAGSKEQYDLPVYNFGFPGDKFVVAKPVRGGWVARVPPGAGAYVKRAEGWVEARGDTDARGITHVPLEIARPLRMVHGRVCVELVPELVPRVALRNARDVIDPTVGYPFAGALVLAGLMILIMPSLQKDVPDFSPQQLKPLKVVLQPPPKKPEKKKKEEKEKEEAKKEEPKETPKPKPQPTHVQPKPEKQVATVLKEVKKITSGAAVQNLLSALNKMQTGPKGYGDKGMGFKLSPLIGKPPIAMAGQQFGAGMGGFGALTKGMAAFRGMGNGGGPGGLNIGGMGKGKVGGLVVSAPKGQAHIQGQMDRELIAKVINDHIGEIRGCYERALLREPGLAGKLVFEWTIDLSGSVSDVKTKLAGLKSADATNCMINNLRTWRFPHPKGGNVVVSYPFIFNSVGF
jgi:hypothetical protein